MNFFPIPVPDYQTNGGAHLALGILALPAPVPVEDLVLLWQRDGRRLAVKRTPRVVVHLPACPAYVEHVFLAQGRVLVKDGNYCPLKERGSAIT